MKSCEELFSSSGLEGKDLQAAIEAEFPNGECELTSVSRYSPGPVADDETLTRLVFHPIHTHPSTGEPVSMAFADIWSSDLSVFREEVVSESEVLLAIQQMKETGLRKATPQQRTVIAAMSVVTRILRSETTGVNGLRTFRVYDTAEEKKPHHASVFITKAGRETFSEKAARKKLFELFSFVPNYRFSTPPR